MYFAAEMMPVYGIFSELYFLVFWQILRNVSLKETNTPYSKRQEDKS